MVCFKPVVPTAAISPPIPTLYTRPTLLPKVVAGELKPSLVVTHVLPLEDAPKGFKIFNDKEDKCVKVVLKPSSGSSSSLGKQPASAVAHAAAQKADMK